MKQHVEKVALVLILPFVFQASLVQAESCADTLKTINSLYNNLADECRNPDGSPDPLTDCSGLIIRGVERPNKNALNIWSPSPSEAELGTTSAYWMRADVNFLTPEPAHRSGYILNPVDSVPANEPKSHIACIAPGPFLSDRRDDRGCGDSLSTPAQEKSCDAIGVTGTNWVVKEFPRALLDVNNTCAFYMKRGHDRVTAAKDFVLARKSIQNIDSTGKWPAELRFYHPTEANTQSVLAFFCSDSASCREALLNREEYKKVVNKDKNIIMIEFPEFSFLPATFRCIPS